MLCGPSIKIPLMWHLWKGLCLDILPSPYVKSQGKSIDLKCLYINWQLSVLKYFSFHMSESFWPFRVVLCVCFHVYKILAVNIVKFTHQTGRRILQIIVRQRNIKKVWKKKLSTLNLLNNGKFLTNQWYCNWTGDIFRASLLWLFHPPIWNLLTVLPA